MPRFRVPASTTNLGHGFDCLGMALGLGNVITVEPTAGDGVAAPGPADTGLAPMAERVRDECRRAWGRELPGLSVSVSGDVPIARGMGSSATILLGVAAACRELAGLPNDLAALITIASAIEGHPDNVTAACLGGFTVVGSTADGLRWARFAVPEDLIAVIAIPPFEVKTSAARAILPSEIGRAEVVTALQRTALITAAFAQDRVDDLISLFDGAWHERHRGSLNPGLHEARVAAAAAGAIGTILSGSGSSVLSFARRASGEAVRQAVEQSYRARAVDATVLVTGFDPVGIQRLS